MPGGETGQAQSTMYPDLAFSGFQVVLHVSPATQKPLLAHEIGNLMHTSSMALSMLPIVCIPDACSNSTRKCRGVGAVAIERETHRQDLSAP